MKKTILVAIMFVAIAATYSEAQLPPNYDGKGAVSDKTDSVLSSGPGQLNLTIPVPRSLSGLKFNLTSPEILDTLSLNFRAVFEMVALLEARGAKVEANLSEIKGVTLLNLKVDGKTIDPIGVECRDCVIVFEY